MRFFLEKIIFCEEIFFSEIFVKITLSDVVLLLFFSLDFLRNALFENLLFGNFCSEFFSGNFSEFFSCHFNTTIGSKCDGFCDARAGVQRNWVF